MLIQRGNQCLKVRHNSIEQLPLSLLSLKKLAELYLYGNPLIPPFDSIFVGMEQSEKTVSEWERTRGVLLELRLRETIRQCQENSSKRLRLDAESGMSTTQSLPCSLLDLQDLQELELFDAFKLQSIPPEITKLVNLEYVGVEQACLFGIPDSIMQMTTLKVRIVCFSDAFEGLTQFVPL